MGRGLQRPVVTLLSGRPSFMKIMRKEVDFQLSVSTASHAREGNIGDLKFMFEAEPKTSPLRRDTS